MSFFWYHFLKSLMASEWALTRPIWSSFTVSARWSSASKKGSYLETSGSLTSTGRYFSHQSKGMTTICPLCRSMT